MKCRTANLILLIFVFILFSGLNAGAADEVRLSLSDCLNIGLSNNLDIKIAKIEARMKWQDVLVTESIFDTILTGKAAYGNDRRATPVTLFENETRTVEYEIGVDKTLPTGTEISVDYGDIHRTSLSVYYPNSPHETEFSVSATQPILKNFFGYIDRQTVRLSKIEAELGNLQALDRIENAIADIEKAYWRLVFAYQNVALRKELLAQAEELYERFKAHMKTGLVEVTQFYETEANMRIRQTNLIVAQNDLTTASNNLLLLLNESPEFLVLPEDRLEIIWGRADLVQSINEAFIANRDYKIKKKELTAKKVNLKMKKNNLWPEVDLVGTFAINGIDTKFAKATKRLGTGEAPYFYAGVEVNVPLENNEARGEFNRALLEKRKAILGVLKVEKKLATKIDEEVRDVNISLENAKRWTGIKEIQYRKFTEEEKNLKYGRSNSKNVIDYQNDFTRAAISEYLAILEYYYALIDLENAKDTLLRKVGVLGR